MSELATSPLVLAIAAAALGSGLLAWHRHGGPRWTLAAGGFVFVLSRVMMIAICAFMLGGLALFPLDAERALIGLGFAALFLAVGAWSVVVLVRLVGRDAFGAVGEGRG